MESHWRSVQLTALDFYDWFTAQPLQAQLFLDALGMVFALTCILMVFYGPSARVEALQAARRRARVERQRQRQLKAQPSQPPQPKPQPPKRDGTTKKKPKPKVPARRPPTPTPAPSTPPPPTPSDREWKFTSWGTHRPAPPLNRSKPADSPPATLQPPQRRPGWVSPYARDKSASADDTPAPAASAATPPGRPTTAEEFFASAARLQALVDNAKEDAPQTADQSLPAPDEAAHGPDSAAYAYIGQLVGVFRAWARSANATPNGIERGVGAALVTRRSEVVGYNSVPADFDCNQPFWTSQVPPSSAGRMEIYVSDRAWVILGSYYEFDGKAATPRAWTLHSRFPSKSALREDPLQGCKVGVTVFAAAQFAYSCMHDWSEPRY